MRDLVLLLRRFRDDERGVFAIIFGILAVALIAAAGAVVDFSAIQQARTRAQVALDSAALGLQPTIFTTGVTADTIKPKALALVTERLNDNRITVALDTPVINTTDGSLKLTGTITVPTAFVALVGIPNIKVKMLAEATRKRLNLEVVMVLDNSNSMDDYSRMTNLKSAAKCAANILLNSDCASTATTTASANTYIGVVPFTLSVNVGTGNASATWMDRSGASSAITLDNFDNDDKDTAKALTSFDRIATINGMTGVTWGGCVEARIHDTASSPQRLYDTDDTVPSASTPYSLFTPYFAPDEPDSGYSNSYIPDRPSTCTSKDLATWSETSSKTNCTSTWSNSSSDSSRLTTFNNCSSTASTTRTQKNSSGTAVTPAATTAPANGATNNYNDPSCSYSWTSNRSGSFGNYRYALSYTYDCTYEFSDRELLERICKYSGATPSGVSQSSVKGPNGDCPVNAIQPLTSTKSLVTAALDALDPQGGTNIHAGTEWGFRVLSPTAPFTEGQAYSNSTSKVMIVMTDGENTAYSSSNMNGSRYYSHYAYPYNGRLGSPGDSSSTMETEMNNRLKQTCTNAKNAGIEIYTIGLDVEETSDPDTNTQLLKDCSSGAGYWYFPTEPSQLTTVFTTIANKLSVLRLAK